MTPTKEELKRLLDVLSEFEWDTADLDLVESYTEGPHYPKLHGLVRLALSALEPKGQAPPEMKLWSEERIQHAIEDRGLDDAGVDHIRALQRHILSAKAVEWRKVREKLLKAKEDLELGLLSTTHGYVCEALSLLPAEGGERRV